MQKIHNRLLLMLKERARRNLMGVTGRPQGDINFGYETETPNCGMGKEKDGKWEV